MIKRIYFLFFSFFLFAFLTHITTSIVFATDKTAISGTVSITNPTAAVTKKMHVNLKGKDSKGNTNNFDRTVDTVNSPSVGYYIEIQTNDSVTGHNGSLDYSIELLDESGKNIGGSTGTTTIIYGQANIFNTTATLNGSSANTCESVDNDDNHDGVNGGPGDAFKCASTCSAPFSNENRNGQPNFKCTTGICCVNLDIYHARPKNSPVKPDTSGGSSGGTTPGATTPGTTTNTPVPNRPEAFPCEFHKGQKTYLGAYCGSADGKTHEQFDPTKAASKAFCSMTYIDAYKCIDDTDVYFPIPGNTTCASAPWCPGPKTTPGPDAGCKAYQAQPCTLKDGKPDYSNSLSCCAPNQNLECVDRAKTGNPQCQYINDTPFTPTPGSPSTEDCATQIANRRGSMGCACPDGGGCGTGLGCYAEAGGSMSDNKTWKCSTGPGKWCEKSKTEVENAAACGTATPYKTPTPTPKDLSYQADCPNTNPDSSPNACVLGTSCPTGYEQHASTGTPGGTNGNKACTEFEGGQPSICCTKKAGSTGPVATSAPTPTPTPLSSSSKPTGPNIPFSSVGTCPAGLEGYWKGTYCDTDKSYYDVYCYGGVPSKNTVTGITCQ